MTSLSISLFLSDTSTVQAWFCTTILVILQYKKKTLFQQLQGLQKSYALSSQYYDVLLRLGKNMLCQFYFENMHNSQYFEAACLNFEVGYHY